MFDKDRDPDALDPDAPPTEEELRGAASLRDSLAPLDTPKKSRAHAPPLGPEAKWLLAHLRVPQADDSIGELRARGLARAARETLLAKRTHAARRGTGAELWRHLGRSLSGTGRLLGAAALVLLVSWMLLDRSRTRAPQRDTLANDRTVATALLLRSSLEKHESPSLRLDLMLQERLSQHRNGRRGRATTTAGSLAVAAPGTP